VEFNEVACDYRGNVMYSTMITKLCAFTRRTEFILGILQEMMVENPTQQIIVLAHNRSLLTYMHNAVAVRGFATVGYYVGGMKELALKESEGKQVIMATYSMAAEALDIKTLTTLIMATPKTDIEQAVGRILRQRHGNPVVVDILDSHTPFRNQWNKRKAFYRKQGYSIVFPKGGGKDVKGRKQDCSEVVEDEAEVGGKCFIPIGDME
jgi:superfamily II DNA or RNA helicase